MANNKVNVYLLSIVAVVSIIALVTIYVSMNGIGSISMPEEAIVGRAGESGCTDSDGGLNMAEAGTVTSALGVPSTDKCSTTSIGWLTEYLCSDGRRVEIEYDCTRISGDTCLTNVYGGYCGKSVVLADSGISIEDGSALSIGTIETTFVGESSTGCEDTDGGNRPLDGGIVTAGGVISPDACSSTTSGRLNEYVCTREGAVLVEFICSLTISGGECIPDPEGAFCGVPLSCEDTDDGVNRIEAGTVTTADGSTETDYCTPGGGLLEYSCAADGSIRGDTDVCGRIDSIFICIEGTDGAYCGTPPTEDSGTSTISRSPASGSSIIPDTEISLGSGLALDTSSPSLEVLPEGHWSRSRAATNSVIIRFFFRGSITNVVGYIRP